ncbi:minor capsid protein [Pseudomonas sp. CA3A]|uniref:Minor capsid protein n=2 Tax=Pseudomonas typographi TaxID=2715964 RepID=A0ABR7Z9H8_9PSED|nr:minor capsid protein [Pseudomonas typographi]MBD1602087.1 minor capsid protein [Pseudomonas typographi]
MMERVKADEVQKFEAYLRRIDRLVRDQLTRKELTTYSRERLEEFLARVDGRLLEIYKAYGDLLQADLVDIALYQAAFEAKSLNAAYPTLGAIVPSNAVIRAALAVAPLQVQGIDGGKLLKTIVQSWVRSETTRVTSSIRLGYIQGQTNSQIVQAIRGTAAQNYTDGVLAISERNTRSVVQTAVQHVATTARMETFNANPDVVRGYRWVSTLDRRTSALCKSLDGRTFKLGKGPLPPAHFNCRSTTKAVTRLDDLFEKGATRASSGANGGAQVPADQNYYQWLATQPAGFQDLALGPVRAKLFRDGGLTLEKWASLQLDSNFKPLTLQALKKLDPDMFKRAGVN